MDRERGKMKFAEFFELIRQHKDMAGEAKRIGVLDKMDWATVSGSWCLLAFEHFGVMIDRWRNANPDDLPQFWIEQRKKAFREIMRRMHEELKEEVGSRCLT